MGIVSNITAIAAIDAIKAAFAEAETSRRKANTAASTGKATGWMNNELSVTLPLASNNLLTKVPDGVPLRCSGILGGGLGIAGGTVAQYNQIAQAKLIAIGADPIYGNYMAKSK